MGTKLVIDDIDRAISEVSERRLRELSRGIPPTTPLLFNHAYVQEACTNFLEQIELEREDRWSLPRRWLLFAALQQRYADSGASRDAADLEIRQIQKRVRHFQSLQGGGRGARSFYRAHGASTLLLQQRLQTECAQIAERVEALRRGDPDNLIEICATQYGGYSSNELVARCYQQAFLIGAQEDWRSLREALGGLPDLWRHFNPIAVPLYEIQGLQAYIRGAQADDFKRLARLARASLLDYPGWPCARDIMYAIFHYPNATDDLIARFAEPLLVAEHEPQWWSARTRWSINTRDTKALLSLTVHHPLPANDADQVWAMVARRWEMRALLDPNDAEDPRAPRLLRATATIEGTLALWRELAERRLRARLEIVLRATSGAVLETSFGMRIRGVPVLVQVWCGLKLPNAWDSDDDLAGFLIAQLPSLLPLEQIPFVMRRSPEEHALPVSTVVDYELLAPLINSTLDEDFLLGHRRRVDLCSHRDAHWRRSEGLPAGVVLGCRDCARARLAFVPLSSLSIAQREQLHLQDIDGPAGDEPGADRAHIELLRALSPRGLSWETLDPDDLLQPSAYRTVPAGRIMGSEAATSPRSIGDVFRRGPTAK